MKQSKTTLKELTAAYRAVLRHGILCNAIALGLMAVATPVMAGDPTTGNAWVFGDVSFTGQHVATGAAAFGGRRLADSNVSGKYHNVFPQYNMVGQSFALYNSDAYFGPITLTLGTLDEGDNFAFNWQAPDSDVNADIDIAAAAQIGWGEDVESIVGKLTVAMTEVFTPLYDTTTEAGQTALANAVSAGVNGAAGAVYAMSRTDTNANNDGVLTIDNVNAVVDGATITANKISVSGGSKLTFDKQDTTLLNTSAIFYTNKADIISDGVTTLNADEVTIDRSSLEVKSGAKLVVNTSETGFGWNFFVNGHTDTEYDYGALTVNGDGSIRTTGYKVQIVNNKTKSHGAGLYFKDQTYGHGTEHGTNSVELLSENISFVSNEIVESATSGSGGAIFATGGSVSILGENIGFTSNSMNATVAANRVFKTGGGAIANQSYAVEKGDNKDSPIDADMVIGKGGDLDYIGFSNNTSKTNGGAIMNRAVDDDGDATLTINSGWMTQFTSNHADINGGAIYNIARNGRTAEVNLTVGDRYTGDNYRFRNNTAGENGGAIYNEGTLSVISALFGGDTDGANTAKNGGAVYNKASATITDSTFIGNSVLVPVAAGSTYKKEGVGGAIASAGSLTITDSTFTNNTALTTGEGWGLGGALSTVTVYGDTADVTITGSTFTGNRADVGGAVYGMIKASSQHGLSAITISNSTFRGNSARSGAAIANFDIMSVTNGTFTGNETFGEEDGGTVFLGSESITSFTGGSFINNTSDEVGGAIATRKITQGTNSYAHLDIIGTTFKGNSAATTGGAIDNNFYDSVGQDGYVYVSGATFGGTGENEGNSAANGGAIYNHANGTQTGSMYLTDTNFIGNTATTAGGAIYNEGGLLLAGDNRFIGNTANESANDIHNVGDLSIVNHGTTTINGGITGDTGGLIIESGATLNLLGSASIVQDTIALTGGTITAILDKDATTPLFNATEYIGQGTLKLAMAETGTYHVFAGNTFDIESVGWNITNADSGVAFSNSKVYNLSWNLGDITAEKKSVEEIASDSDIAVESAAVVSSIIDSASNSSSQRIKNLSVKLQEKLAQTDTNPTAKAEVEHATKAINPEKESVVQSVASSVQNTIVNIASTRMGPAMGVGRNGGDVRLTGRGAWVQGIYNKSRYVDAFDGHTRGFAAGIDGTLNKKTTLGLGYSFAHSNIGGSTRDTEIDSSTLFVYGQYKPKAWYVNGLINYTMSDYTETGEAIGIGISADYKVNSFGAHIATGYETPVGIIPEIGLRYMHVMGDEYINSVGIKNNLADTNYLTAMAGMKHIANIKLKKSAIRPDLHYAIKYDLMSDDNVATVVIPGATPYSLNGSNLSKLGGEIGVGFGINYRGVDFSINYDSEIRERYISQTGSLKFRYEF